MCSKIIEKVRKLFALSENNNSEEEAQSALLMARKMLQEHGLSMMDVEVKLSEEDVRIGCDEVELENRRMLPIWIIALSGILGEYFEVGCAYINKSHWHRISYYGSKINSRAAGAIFPNLVSQIEDLAKKYKTSEMGFSNNKSYTRKIRESYIFGLVRGFQDRLKKEKLVEEDSKTALAIYNKDLASQWVDQAGWKVKEVKRSPKNLEKDAFAKGFSDSSQLSLTKGLPGITNV